MRKQGSPRRIFLVGAGNRGKKYAEWIKKNPGHFKITGVADPVAARRTFIAAEHGLSESQCFPGWKELVSSRIDAEGVIIATGDDAHTGPALAFLGIGMHVLLEKPMVLKKEDLSLILNASKKGEEKGGSLTVCHVLRYSPFFKKIKEILDSGEIGEAHSLYHAENVSYYHFAHSYVRGNWRNSSESSPVILAKSSHDLDLIQWFAGSNPVWIASTSERSVFIPGKTPVGAPQQCSKECPVYESCLYNAEKTYLKGIPVKIALSRAKGVTGLTASFMSTFPRFAGILPFLSRYRVWKEWPTNAITDDLTPEGIKNALETGPYGRCVYQCDNDQPEHQETIIKFESGLTASFRLQGLSFEEGRTLRIDGTRGSIRGKFGSGSDIRVYVKGRKKERVIHVESDFIGHTQADTGLMESWVRVFSGEKPASSGENSVLGHVMAFAADQSARTGRGVYLKNFFSG